MRERAQIAAMRRGLPNVITVGHVMKLEEGQDIFLDLDGPQVMWLKFISLWCWWEGTLCLFVCLCHWGFQTDLAEIRSD